MQNNDSTNEFNCAIWELNQPKAPASTEEFLPLSRNACKTLILREGRRLLDKYGLSDWSTEVVEKSKGWLGQCDRLRRSIGIAQHFVEAGPTLDVLQDLLLHEIAHALTKGGNNFTRKRKYAELLASHFDAEKVGEFLENDRYCKKYMDRLLDELNITQLKSVA